jgi:hypothetical protein
MPYTSLRLDDILSAEIITATAAGVAEPHPQQFHEK